MKSEIKRLAKIVHTNLIASNRKVRNLLMSIIKPELYEYHNETRNDRWIIEHVFPGKRNGYFIEAGAAGGIDGSCCYVLEKELGWTGICVEPNSTFFEQLIINRPNSICENVCLARQSGQVKYIEGSSETVSPYLGGIKSNLETIKYEGQKVIQRGKEVEKHSMTLESILKKHHAPSVIDFAAFDIEGSELEVLEGFPFDKYTFLALSLECDGSIWDEISRLLIPNGYNEVKNPFNHDKYWERYWLHRSTMES